MLRALFNLFMVLAFLSFIISRALSFLFLGMVGLIILISVHEQKAEIFDN
jgi:uncharacterized membrane protein